MLNQEDTRWRQRAKRHWLTGGDINTKYYHACVNLRRKKNTIKRVVDRDGTELREKVEIATGFKRHFSAVFKSTQPNSACIIQCLQGVEQRITTEMLDKLERDFTVKEVEEALKQMSPFKSPGPDGFSEGFYQEHWKIVGQDVSQTVLDFLKSGKMPRDLNHTHIALIPKVNSTNSVHEF